MSEEEFPVAETKTSSAKSWIAAGMSRMWIATIACLLFAIGLTWYSIGESGTEISLHFKQGHGLKPGDALRHRGIDVGEVTSVQLDSELSGIQVKAELRPGAQGVANEGSRFWIVRPQLDLTGIRGLETAVGAKYIAVSPGPIASPIRKQEFVGLESPPADELGQGGLELMLRGDERYGVNPGSPVTWRGIEVGQVLSSSLSPDAMHVDIRIRIDANHQRLVAANSKFWSISGIHFDMGVSGVTFSAESFATIVRGGIAFITPASTTQRESVQAGDVFTLHEEQEDSWTAEAVAINLLQVHPPPTVTLIASWSEKLLGFKRAKQRRAVAIVVSEDDGARLLVPADFVTAPEDAVEGSFLLQLDGEPNVQIADAGSGATATLARLKITGKQLAVASKDRFRAPAELEDCFAVRQTRTENGDRKVVVEAIGKHELTIEGNLWRTTKSKLSADVWHGAAVLSADDEKVIGVLLIDDHIKIAPIRTADL